MAIDLTVELHGFSTIWGCSKPEKKKHHVFPEFCCFWVDVYMKIEWDEHITNSLSAFTHH